MSQKPKKKAQGSKAKDDKDSAKQMKQNAQDDASKQTFDTKESKETVDEKELRRTAKDSESTIQQLISDLLEEKEKQQKEMQKLQEEIIKLHQSDEGKTKLKKELDETKDLLTEKESEITRLKEYIDSLQRRTTNEVRGLEHLNYCLNSLLQDCHNHVLSGAETIPEAMKQPDEIQPESSLGKGDQHVKEIREMFIKLESVNGELKNENLCLIYLMNALHSCVTSERKTKDITLELPDDMKCHSSLASIYKQAENIAKKFKETEIHKSPDRYPAVKTTVMEINCRTDFQHRGKNIEDDTARSDNKNKVIESRKDSGPPQVSNEETEEEEGKRIRKAEHCTENLHEKADTEDKYKRHIDGLEVRVKELIEEKNQLLNRLSQVTKEEKERKQVQKAESLPENILKKTGTKDKYTKRIEELENGVKALTEEKNQLLNRLSELGAMRLTDNNPNVTDLSDANRPEKLVEQFSELYENEWTDAYEHLTKTQGKTVKHSVKLLLLVLKDTYGICLSSTNEKTTTLRKAMLCYAGLSDEDSSELELQEIEKKMSEYRAKKSHCNITRVQEDVKRNFINRPDQFKTDMSSTFTAYIHGCVRICWFMSIKNPPMYLDFGDREESVATNGTRPTSSHFEKSKFVSYTKSGDNVEYVVWPVVYLHKGGPIMRKGVAQASHA